MKKIGFIIVFLLLVNFIYSQDNYVFVSNNPFGNGIAVKWVTNSLFYREGVNIYRSENGGEFEKIKMVIPPSETPTGLTPKQNNLYYSFLNMSPSEYKKSFDIVFTAMESINDYSFAEKVGLAYTDIATVQGITYQYKIETGGNVIGITDKIIAKPFKPVEAPENFTLTRGRRYTKIYWKNNVKKYYTYSVYMKKGNDTEWKPIAENHSAAGLTETKKKYYLNVPTHKDTVYEFKIEAQDYFGQKSQISQVYKLKVVDLDPPIAPEVRTAVYAKKKEVVLSWDEPVDSDILGYNILRTTKDNDTVYSLVNSQIIGANDTTYTDNVSNSGIYYYRLQIIDKAQNKSHTFPYMVELYDVFPPNSPTNLKAIADTGKLILTWDKVSAPDLKGYQLMRSVADEDNSDNMYVPVSPFYFDTNYYEEEMAANVRNPFVYVVKAVDTFLNVSSASNMATVQLPDVTPPKAPFFKQFYEEEGNLAIKWMPNVEPDLKGYNLYKRKKGDTTQFYQVNVSLIPPLVQVYIDKEAERGQFYEYKLMAIDQADLKSPFSNEILGKLEHLELAGDINIIKNKLNKNRRQITIEWNTDSLINEPILGTSVYRAYEKEMPLPITKVITETRFKQKLDKPGKYTYHIRAFGERGNIIKSKTIEFNIN